MISLSLLFFSAFQIPATLATMDFLNNEDHIGRDHIIMAVNAVRAVSKRKLLFQISDFNSSSPSYGITNF